MPSASRVHHELLTAEHQRINYRVRRYARARNLRLTVNCDATVVLTIPKYVSFREAENFVKRKTSWILDKIASFQNKQTHWCCRGPKEEYESHREEAKVLVAKKIAEFNSFYQFPHKRVSIKNQKSRWGSCSAHGNLNFNYKLAFLDERLVDYVIVHELCHLKELNHSRKFWNLVAQTVPDFEVRRSELMKKRF